MGLEMRRLALLPALLTIIALGTAFGVGRRALEPTTEPPTITPSPTWEPTPNGATGPFSFPANVNPLTGQQVDDPTVLQRRPLAVKISNAPALVRPQAGIGEAD